MKKLAEVLRPMGVRNLDAHRIGGGCRGDATGEAPMGRMEDVRVIAMRAPETVAAGEPPPGLPNALTWSATLDPHDDTHEIEITDEMVRLALDQIEEEQVYPFRREAGTPPPVARTVRKADVIPFPDVR